ncbi:hypothetical protein DENSPDRAFT_752872, partial [Dentipellis sp. KUC8613]
IREAIVKECRGDIDQWPSKLPHALFADKVTVSQVTGFSPFFLIHGVHPVLPFDLTEATFLVEGFRSGMSASSLLALRMRQIEKRPQDIKNAAAKLKKYRLGSKAQFEKRFKHALRTEPFKPGDYVLVRNSLVERELNRKTKPRYIGPYQVVRRTRNGAYILQELTGVISRSTVAAFRLIPY